MAVYVEYESVMGAPYVLFSCIDVYILPTTIGVPYLLIS